MVAKKNIKKPVVAKKTVAKKAVAKKAVPVKKQNVRVTIASASAVAKVKKEVEQGLAISYNDKSYVAYFGEKKWAWYKRADEKFTTSRGIVWSWWAFFFSSFFLLERKNYFAGAMLLILSTSSIFQPANMGLYYSLINFFYIMLFACLLSILSPYLVLSKFKRDKELVERMESNEEKRLKYLSLKGGKSGWGIGLFIGYIVATFIYVGVIIYFVNQVADDGAMVNEQQIEQVESVETQQIDTEAQIQE